MKYFVRHGESEANLKGTRAGQRENSPLTSRGYDQARQAADDIRGILFKRIISSPLLRARETARTVAEIIGFSIDLIEYDNRLMEYDMGDLTGTPIAPLTAAERFSANNAEDPDEFRDRIISVLKELASSEETILVVSHNGVGRQIEGMRQGIDASQSFELEGMPNAHAVQLELSFLNGSDGR